MIQKSWLKDSKNIPDMVERENARKIVNTSEEFKPPAVVINEQLVQKVQDTRQNSESRNALSFDDIANV